MNRRAVALGVALVAAGLAVFVGVFAALGATPKPETAAPGLAGALGLAVGVVVFVVAVVRSRRGSDGEPAPWTERGRLVDSPPEETPDDVAVSGVETAETLAAAARAARSAGDVEAGVEQVRPRLRRSLGRALVASGRDPDAVERALADGTWTDDDLAAAVLDESVAPPRRTLRERLRDWLFPERAMRERTRRAVAAVDEAAGEALPAVVGEDAPRTVPVHGPALEDLQRTADGRLQRAATLGAGGWREAGADATDGTGPGAPGPDGTAANGPGAFGRAGDERDGSESGPPGQDGTDGVTVDGDRDSGADADWDDVRGERR